MTITELIKRGTQYELATCCTNSKTGKPRVCVKTRRLTDILEALEDEYDIFEYNRGFYIDLKQSEIAEFLAFHLPVFEAETYRKIVEAEAKEEDFKLKCKEIMVYLELKNEH